MRGLAWVVREGKEKREEEEEFLSREIHLAYSAGARGENFFNTRQKKLSIQFYLVPDNSRLTRHTSSRARVDRIKKKRNLIPLTFNHNESVEQHNSYKVTFNFDNN